MVVPKWNEIDSETKDGYSMSGRIPIVVKHYDEPLESQSPVWSRTLIEKGVELAHARSMLENIRSYDPSTVQDLYAALDSYPIQGKDVVVIGSRRPWIEVVCIAFGAASVTTVDYTPPVCESSLIRTKGVAEHSASDQKYDVMFSFSSIEHDGLGRYGDPISPNADIERIQEMKSYLCEGGMLFLGVPVGKDCVVFNAHRIYGPIRLPMLTEGWKTLKIFADLDNLFQYRTPHFSQTWIILQK